MAVSFNGIRINGRISSLLADLPLVIPDPHWIATLGGTASDIGHDVVIDSAGNIYVIGEEASQGITGANVLFLKYDPSGNLLWQTAIGTSGTDRGYGICISATNEIVIVGTMSNHAFVRKYASNGTLSWHKTMAYTGTFTLFYDIWIDLSDNIYAAGYRLSGTSAFLLTKLDTDGNEQWSRSVTGAAAPNGTTAQSVVGYTDGSIYVAGDYWPAATDTGCLLVKYNSSGTLQWQRSVTTIDSAFVGIDVDSSGNVYAIGNSPRSGASTDGHIIKYNSSGTIQWQRQLGIATGDSFFGIKIDTDDSIYVCGNTGAIDILIAKYNSSGALQWQRTVAGSNNDTSYILDIHGDVLYVIGRSTSGSFGGYDTILIAIPKDGTLTGTFGNYTYGTSSLTAITSGLVGATSTFTSSSVTPTYPGLTINLYTPTLSTTRTLIV